MYKFTNGIVSFDEKTRDNYLKAGYEHIDLSEEQKEILTKSMVEVLNENSSNNGIIEEEYTRSNTKTTKNRK